MVNERVRIGEQGFSLQNPTGMQGGKLVCLSHSRPNAMLKPSTEIKSTASVQYSKTHPCVMTRMKPWMRVKVPSVFKDFRLDTSDDITREPVPHQEHPWRRRKNLGLLFRCQQTACGYTL